MKRKLSYVFLIFVVLSFHFLARGLCPRDFLSGDEAVSALMANVIVDGKLPYVDAIDHRGPVTYYFYAFVFSLFGKGNMAAVHAFYEWIIAIAAGVMFLIGRECFNKRVGIMAALFMIVYSWLGPPGDMWAAHTEYTMIFFNLWAVLAFVHYQKRQKAWKLVLAGALFGLATLSKQVAAFDVLTVAVFLLIVEVFGQRNFLRLVKSYVLLGIGFLLPHIFFIVYFYVRQGLREYLFCIWEFNVKYYVSFSNVSGRIHNFLKSFYVFSGNKLLLLFLGFMGARYSLLFLRRKPDYVSSENMRFGAFLTLWVMISFGGVLSGGNAFQHYYIQWLPPLCLLAAFGFDALLTLFKMNFSNRATNLRTCSWSSLGILALCMVLLVSISAHVVRYIEFYADEPRSVISKYIRENTSEQDKIFVWGFYPELYLMAQRQPASRYTFCVFQIKKVPGSWDRLMKDLEENQPKYIVDVCFLGLRGFSLQQHVENFPLLKQLLDREYIPDPDFFGNRRMRTLIKKNVLYIRKDSRHDG